MTSNHCVGIVLEGFHIFQSTLSESTCDATSVCGTAMGQSFMFAGIVSGLAPIASRCSDGEVMTE